MQISPRDQRLSVLETSWLFQAATQGDREWLAPRCTMVRHRRGARIVGRGVPGQCLYVVAQGRVKGTLPSPMGDGEFLIGLLWPGDVFGEASVLEKSAAFGNALAMSDVQLLVVPRADMLTVLERRPQLSMRLMASMAGKLRTALDLSLSLRFLDVATRFYQRLLYLARFDCARDGDGMLIRHGLSQQELADSIGASREALNKVIGEWKREGLLEWGRGHVVVRDPVALSRRMPAFLKQEEMFGAAGAPGFGPWPSYSQLPSTDGRGRGALWQKPADGAHWNR